MPRKPKKPCGYPGCPELIESDERYCRYHNKQVRWEYDRNRKNAAQRGYDSRWQKYRKWYLRRHPLCVNFKDCGNMAEVVDHITPVSKGGSFWDPDNHQPMCKFCHDRKTAREDGGFGNKPKGDRR